MSTPIKRKLAAILSADVAGYSRLMGDDEEGTLRLLAAHRAVVDSIITFHDGRVVNTAGDSVLAEFTSPVEAVRAATEIQEALKTRNESLPEGGRMLFRIGVNLGDVMIKGDDLLGDGVNVAARLQALAEPGGICISGSIFDQIEGKLSLHFQDIGEQSLKNIPHTVRALQLRGPAPKAAPRSAAAHPRARHGAIAALIGAGLIALTGGAYLGGFVPPIGTRDGGQEAAAWKAVQNSSDMTALERYLAEYPTGPHAAEARARIAGLLAGARQAVEAERSASERARAEADLARLKAQAETARLKVEAERAEMDRKKAEEERASATKARAEAETAKTSGEPARAKALLPRQTAAVAPTDARESRFDGVWVGELNCPGQRGNPDLQRAQRGVVRNGEMTLNMPGRLRPTRAAGKVQDDDSIELRGPAVGPAGRAFDHVVKGRFAGNSFIGQAEPPARPCSVQLSREAAPARPGR